MAGQLDDHTCICVVYVAATAEDVWRALTEPEASLRWWAHRNVSDWRTGSPWEHRRVDDDDAVDIAGDVLESAPPVRLVVTWANPVDGTPVGGVPPSPRTGPSRVTFELDGYRDITRLTVVHDGLASDAERDALLAGWAAVLSNLKTFLETGEPLPTPPWEMLAGFVR
jgi:uncharacterized protein YndB with AHSA1/START domain